MPRKACVKCKKRRNFKSFPKHKHHKDGLDSRCKKCIGKDTRIRNKLHKKAPRKPSICVICKKEPHDFNTPYKWHLDHDRKTKKFRGWLCEHCNRALGVLGDDIDGILDTLNYLITGTQFSQELFDHSANRIISSLNLLLSQKIRKKYKNVKTNARCY